MRCKLLNPPLSNTNSNTEGVMTLALHITQVQRVGLLVAGKMWPSMFAKCTIHTKFQMIQQTSSRTTRRQGKDRILSKESMLTKGLEWKPCKAVTGLWNRTYFWLPYHILIRAKDAYCWTKFLQVGVAFSRNMPPETPWFPRESLPVQPTERQNKSLETASKWD